MFGLQDRLLALVAVASRGPAAGGDGRTGSEGPGERPWAGCWSRRWR